MRRPLGKAGECALKVAGLFAVLEPVWMLLPFAGFLYGSVLNISLISRVPVVSRLAHFVFPVHTLFPTGLVLMGLGTLLFLAGAGQIYYAKLAKKGLVTRGLYRFARHPQYTALVLFGAGALLTWGRLIAWIAFAGMMCLYYFLARKEERGCAEAFGDPYRAYAARTPFAFPGDRRLVKLVPAGLPRWAGVCAVLLTWLCLGLVVQTVFGAFREVRFLAADVSAEGQAPSEARPALTEVDATDGAGVGAIERYILVRAPVRPAVSDEKFARRVLEIALGSEAYLGELRSRAMGKTTAMAFVTPGRGWRGSHDRSNAHVRLLTMLLRRTPGARDEDVVDPNEPGSREVYTAFFLEFDLGRGVAVGKAERRGPRPKAGRRPPWMFRSRMQERIRFFTSGL